MWRLIYFIPTWLLFFFLISLPTIILGWVFIVPAAILDLTTIRKSRVHDRLIDVWSIPLMWIWGNEEDGICAGRQYCYFKSNTLQTIYWSALRNPVNNLRYVPYLSCIVNPSKIQFIGSFGDSDQKYLPKEEVLKYDTKVPHWFLCWQGLYSGFYWQFNLFGLRRFWIGWKVYPGSIYKVPEYQKHGAGFAAQLKKVRV
jgi:hypothetical protein